MSADPRSSKHDKSCQYEIKSTQPGSQIYVTIDRYLLAIIMFKWKKLTQSSYQFEKSQQNVIAMHAGSFHSVRGKTWRSIQDKFYKSKTSSRFPNFDTSNAWQMGHHSREGINFSWARTALGLLLPGSIWLRMPITRLRYISCLRSFRTHFDSLKRADDSWVYRGFMMPLNHQAGIQGTLTRCLRY